MFALPSNGSDDTIIMSHFARGMFLKTSSLSEFACMDNWEQNPIWKIAARNNHNEVNVADSIILKKTIIQRTWEDLVQPCSPTATVNRGQQNTVAELVISSPNVTNSVTGLRVIFPTEKLH